MGEDGTGMDFDDCRAFRCDYCSARLLTGESVSWDDMYS